MSKFALLQHSKPFIYETLTSKALHFSIHEVQSCMDVRHPELLDLEYTRTMMGFLLFHPQPSSIGMIGLGGGSLTKFCLRNLPNADISVAEINPHVIALREQFRVPPDDDRFRVIQIDGADFVHSPPRRFDVLLADGYDRQGLPRQLATQHFYDDCYKTLTPGGMLVANLVLSHEQYVQKVERIRQSFNGSILVVDDAERCNSIVFASKECAPNTPPRNIIGPSSTLNELASNSLQSAFARVLAALKERGSLICLQPPSP
jgi:spermidine synthase